MATREPVRLAEALRRLPGKWVALRGDTILMAADTPYALVMDLHSKGIRYEDVTIVRSPGKGEPLRVGLG
jgi:hypothetical protein